MRLTSNCPTCGKVLIETHAVILSETEVWQEYQCGHAFIKAREEKDIPKSIKTLAVDNSGKKARKYQEDGVKFIVDPPEPNIPFNCVIGDQMRLGKTPQALLALQSYYKERTPCLIIVKSANLWQWIEEYKVWTDTLPLGIYPIVGTKAFIPPGFSAYIISMDTFSRMGMVEQLLSFGFRLVIVDEAHSFKNTESKRSKALVSFLHDISNTEIEKDFKLSCVMCSTDWEEKVKVKVNLRMNQKEQIFSHQTKCPQCGSRTGIRTEKIDIGERTQCGIIMLSGTAIKNRAEEYFILLNIVAPEKFSSLERFRREWLEQDDRGKWTRVQHRRWEDFRETIRPYVLRREKEDVYTDLPALNRMFTVIEIEDGRLKDAYNKVLDRLESNMAAGNYSMFSNIGELNILRQICGMAKVKWTADYAETMLMDSNSSKLGIGIHHHSVRDNLAHALKEFGVMTLSGEDSAERKFRIMKTFESNKERVLAINMLAGGVGMDFHYINNVLILERQWSSADEEQFEFRFYNPDRSIKNVSTNIEYIIAKGTIDEFFYNMVEEKRVVFGETISNNWDVTTDAMSFKMLLEDTVGHRL